MGGAGGHAQHGDGSRSAQNLSLSSRSSRLLLGLPCRQSVVSRRLSPTAISTAGWSLEPASSSVVGSRPRLSPTAISAAGWSLRRRQSSALARCHLGSRLEPASSSVVSSRPLPSRQQAGACVVVSRRLSPTAISAAGWSLALNLSRLPRHLSPESP